MKVNTVTIQAFNNHNKSFTVSAEPGKTILEIVNRHYTDPKREGIPSLCHKGVCRSCTVKIIEHGELLAEPSRLEQRALGVGRTTIALGYRLACMCYFKNP
jgi:ferredoxin